MQNTPSLPSLLGPLWSGEVAPDRVLSIDQIELKKKVLRLNLFETELFICMKMDFALNYLQWLIYHQTKPNQTNSLSFIIIYLFIYLFIIIIHSLELFTSALADGFSLESE